MNLIWDESNASAIAHGELITGLTRLVGLLLDQRQGPEFEFAQVHLMVQGSNSHQIAQVRQWAAAMDVQAEWIEEHTVRAYGKAGPLSIQVYTHLRSEPDAAATLTQLPVVDETPAAQAETWQPLVDESAIPEVACGGCLGTGEGPLGESCIYCLGKGRVMAWQPQHAVEAPAW